LIYNSTWNFEGEEIKMDRRDKHNYYLDIAETVLERGTCLRRNYGSIIVKNDEIISTGYTGAPRGRANCNEIGFCKRDQLNVPRGTQYELCRSVHSEANAIISAARKDMIGASLYLVGKDAKTGELEPNANSCIMCRRLIINAGIEMVIIRDTKDTFRIINVQGWIDEDESLDSTIGY
jgi:dCMP deaminase